MTHLYIELNTGLTEEVNSSIISKLYELAISGDLDETSDLKGRLHSVGGYGVEVQYLTETFSDLYITLDKSYIKFADAAISDKMKKYVGDGNGATIQDVQNILVFGGSRYTSSFGTLNWFNQYNDKILPKTFDEFELFINVTELKNKTFESWINLLSIKLPPNITTIGTLCFDQCSKLTSLAGLSNITTIPNYAFRNCSNLTTVDIDWSKITSIGTCALSKCPIGTGLTIELNLTNQSSHFGSALEKTKFDKIIVHCNWSGNGDGNHPPFSDLPYTTYIDASDCILHSVNGYSLSRVDGDNSLVTVIYPPSVNQIRSGSLGFRNALGTFKYMIILNTTPPDINVDNNNPFSSAFPSNSILHIYVPDSAVSDYLADSKWSQLGGNNGTDTILLRLHGLSELPAGVWTTGLASQYLTPAQLVTT